MDEDRVAARDDERDVGRIGSAVLDEVRPDVAVEAVHPDHPGPTVTAIPSRSRKRIPARSRGAEQRVERFDVGRARDLGNDGAEPHMQIDLRRDQVRPIRSTSTTATAMSSQDVSIQRTSWRGAALRSRSSYRLHQVHGGVDGRVLHRRLHRGLRGQVHHDLGPMPFEQRDEALGPDVHAEEG